MTSSWTVYTGFIHSRFLFFYPLLHSFFWTLNPPLPKALPYLLCKKNVSAFFNEFFFNEEINTMDLITGVQYRCVQMIYSSSCVFCCGIKKQFSACGKRNVSGITITLNNCGPTVSEQVWTCGFHLSVAFPYLSFFHVCLLAFLLELS